MKARLYLFLLPILIFLGLWGLGSYLITGDPLESADAVVLLSGGGEERLDEALRIYNSGLTERLLITETGEIPDGGGPRASLLIHRKAIQAGIPDDAILTTLGKSSSTSDEALAVLAFCEREELHKIIVVTDPYHTRRASVVFDSIFTDREIDVLIQPVRNHWYRSTSWFLSLSGWQVTIREYFKLIGTLSGFSGA